MANANQQPKKGCGCATFFLVFFLIVGCIILFTEDSPGNPTQPSTRPPLQLELSTPSTAGTTLPLGTQPATQGQTVATTQSPTAPPTQAPTAPAMPYAGHVFTGSRDKGYCEEMTGRVAVTILFVSDPGGSWSNADINAYKVELQAMEKRIEQEAATYGAQVDLVFYYHTSSTHETLTSNEERSPWVDDALKNAGLPAFDKVNNALETQYGVSSAPVFFVANHGGRAIAVRYGSGPEYAILYEDAHAFYHELSHLYGAEDFYCPAEVEALADKYLPESLMVNSSDGKMDSLTAYLVGWTDTLSAKAKQFLDATSYLTQEDLDNAYAANSHTGYVTNFQQGDDIITGQLIDGQCHGQCTVIYGNGNRYEGSFYYGKFHGKGTFTWASGECYSGDYVYGKRHGYGSYTYQNGNRYEGDWVDNERTGKGTFIWADGSSYKGDFANNQQHGHGVYTWADGTYFEGYYVNGVRHGKGIMIWPSGNRYEGDFSDGDRTGNGKFIWANGDTYTGTFLKSQMHGDGVFLWSNGNRYEGSYANGKRHGKGTLTWANGNRYTGDWSNGECTGKGTFTWAGGDTYTGDFVNSVRTGYGVYTWPNGDRYEGGFYNNSFHGQGTIYFANGTVRSGTWNNGEFVG